MLNMIFGCICSNNNGYTDILIPIQAINYAVNGCNTALNGVEYESTCRILDPNVLPVSEASGNSSYPLHMVMWC